MDLALTELCEEGEGRRMYSAQRGATKSRASGEYSRLGRWKFVLICLGVLFNVWIAIQTSHVNLSSDFAQFYAAGKLAGTGRLYDVKSITAIERHYGAPPVPTARLPIVAFAWKPLSLLRFAVARNLWLFISLLSGVLAVFLWPDMDRMTMLTALAWSIPASFTLFYGQDVLVWLLFFALGLRLLERGRSFEAGVTFTLCICKFHLLVGLGIMLLARKEWKAITAGVLSTAILVAACFAVEGRTWPHLYRAVIERPGFSPSTNLMPDIYGLVARFPHALLLEILLSGAVASLLWFACRRTTVSVGGALAAAAGLLFAHHAYDYDCVLLLPLCVIVAQNYRLPQSMQLSAVFLLSPFFNILVWSYSGLAQLLVCSFVAFAIVIQARSYCGRTLLPFRSPLW